MDSISIAALMFGVFGSLGTVLICVDKLKEWWIILVNMKWSWCFGDRRMKFLLAEGHIDRTRVFELSKRILQTTCLSQLDRGHGQDLLNALSFIPVTSAIQGNANEGSLAETYDLSFICSCFLGSNQLWFPQSMSATSTPVAWQVLIMLLARKRPKGHNYPMLLYYGAVIKHIEVVIDTTDDDIILQCCGRLLFDLLSEFTDLQPPPLSDDAKRTAFGRMRSHSGVFIGENLIRLLDVRK